MALKISPVRAEILRRMGSTTIIPHPHRTGGPDPSVSGSSCRFDGGAAEIGYHAAAAAARQPPDPAATSMLDVHFELPRLRTLARQALPNLVEGVIAPLVIFYLVMWVAGLWGAIAAALVWSWGAMARRALRRERIPGLLVIGSLGLTARTILAFASNSVFVYFLQPTLGTIALAGVFLLSLPTDRPMAQRLAQDFLPLPPALLAHPAVRRFFLRITLLWAFVQLANAGAAMWLLLSQPVSIFLAARTGVSMGLTGAAIVVSTVYFKRAMRHHGLLIGAQESRARAI